MEQAVKQRLVGAAVLTALAVITVPLIFDTGRPPSVQVTETIPTPPTAPAVDMPAPQPVELPAERPAAEPVAVGDMYQMAGEPPAATDDGAAAAAGSATTTTTALTSGTVTSPDAALDADATEPSSGDSPPAPKTAPPVAETLASVGSKAVTRPPQPAKPAPAPAPVKKPVTPSSAPAGKLDKHGLPESWVVQVAAVSDAAKADSLVAELKLNGYAAFTRKQGDTTRIFVGPKADKAQATRLKAQLDRDMHVQSMVKPYGP